MTFSIVGRDPVTGELGIAVASKFLSVGAVVPWAAHDAGAVATQSWANPAFGPDGISLLREGLSASEALEQLLAVDAMASQRQVGIVDQYGRSATYTGKDCMHWAGGLSGENFAAQGNILTGEAVVTAMARAFQETKGALAHRLVTALAAGDAAGGDSRGRQSAALYVVKTQGGYGGLNDRYIDLRVDDHADPVQELGRLLGLWRLYFEKPDSESMLHMVGNLAVEVAGHLQRLGYMSPGSDFRAAWDRFIGTENFEERDVKPGYIDPAILEWLRAR